MDSILSASSVRDNTVNIPDIDDPVECLVPIYTEDDSDVDFLGLIVVSTSNVSVRYFTRNGWEVIGTYDYKSEPIILDRNTLNSKVYFFGNDAVIVEYLVKRLVNLIEENWNIRYELFTDKLDYSAIRDAQEICTCKSIHDDNIKETVPLSATTTMFLLRCDKCVSPIGIKNNGTKQPVERVLNESFMTTNNSCDDYASVNISPKTKILYTSGEVNEKISTVVTLLSDKAIFEMDIAEKYDPNKHKSAICIHNRDIIGYLLWENVKDKHIIHQVYIREMYRRRGFAQSLIDTWRDTIIETDKFNIMTANSKMRQLLQSIVSPEKTGDLIRTHRCYKLRGTGNKYESLSISSSW